MAPSIPKFNPKFFTQIEEPCAGNAKGENRGKECVWTSFKDTYFCQYCADYKEAIEARRWYTPKNPFAKDKNHQPNGGPANGTK